VIRDLNGSGPDTLIVRGPRTSKTLSSMVHDRKKRNGSRPETSMLPENPECLTSMVHDIRGFNHSMVRDPKPQWFDIGTKQ